MASAFTAYLGQPFTPRISAYDPDNYPGLGLRVAWTQLSGPAEAQFSNRTILSPTIRAPEVGNYVFQVMVTDLITPSSLILSVNVLPLFQAEADYTAYCPLGSIGEKVTQTALGSSDLSMEEARAKAFNSAGLAAEAALGCSLLPPLPALQLNIFGLSQLDPEINQVQLSYLAAGSPDQPVIETPLAVLNGLPITKQPIASVGEIPVEPGNLLFAYSSWQLPDIIGLLQVLGDGPIHLILRAGNRDHFYLPVPLWLDSGPAGTQIDSLAEGPGIAAAPQAVLTLPKNPPASPTRVSLRTGTFIGFDAAAWRSSASPATHLLVAIPQGPLNRPSGLSTLAAVPLGRPTVPPLAEVVRIDPFLSQTALSAPLFLAFYAATFDAGASSFNPIPNSIQFSANSVYPASLSSPPGALNPFSILSLSGVHRLNVPSATSGVIYLPNPKYARLVAGMSLIPSG